MFRRPFWAARPFISSWDQAEDNAFIQGRIDAGHNAINLDDPAFYVAMAHGRNFSPKRFEPANWTPIADTLADLAGPEYAARYHALRLDNGN